MTPDERALLSCYITYGKDSKLSDDEYRQTDIYRYYLRAYVVADAKAELRRPLEWLALKVLTAINWVLERMLRKLRRGE